VKHARLICGVAAAIVVCELGVRAFFGEVHTPRMITIRQYAEGMSTAHYVRSDPQKDYNWRLTGNAPIAGAPEVLIVGDSYIIARQVSDDATMGALIERRSRAEGRPINVRQYGIPGGSAPAYAAAARVLLARWNPAWVIVVLPSNDLTDQPLYSGSYWRMRLGPGDSVETYPVPQPQVKPPTVFGKILTRLRNRSMLVNLLVLRWKDLHPPPPPPHPRASPIDENERVAKVPHASVSLLARGYGDRLLILHLPEISRRSSRRISPAEVRLEEACLKAGIPYVSARDVLIRARDRFVLSRGFWNTTPGDGHLNETGHRLVAGALWQLLEKARQEVHTKKST
jgi:lysophospholipase L1-like esterase